MAGERLREQAAGVGAAQGAEVFQRPRERREVPVRELASPLQRAGLMYNTILHSNYYTILYNTIPYYTIPYYTVVQYSNYSIA